MADIVTFTRHGAVAEACIDNPPVNAASHAVRAGLAAALDRFKEDDTLHALVLRCAGKGFVAGADIKEFGGPMGEPDLPALLDRIEALAKPVVAALHGVALGGGLELALACHARIAAPGTRLGFPEIHIGLLPGAGGTQRAPRLAGLPLAIAMAAQGKRIGAEEALAAGLIDRIAQGPLAEAAIAFAREQAGAPPRRTSALPPPADDPAAFEDARRAVARKFRGQTAPLAALEAIRFGLDHPFEEGLAHERALCLAEMASPQSRALRHLFLAERLVARPAGLDAATPVRPIESVAVVGLGTMGRGIVMALTAAGLPVVAIARDEAGLDKARAAIAKTGAQAVARSLLDEAAQARREALVTWSTDLEAAGRADLIVESIVEAAAPKQALFQALGKIARPGAILASNTSYLDIDALAAASGRAADVCGMHFFNPAHIMRLVECIRGAATAPDVIATIMALARWLGKIGVVSGVCDGFIVNRMLAKRSREAYFLLEEGATPWAIDRVLVEFGFPMGPFALGDLAGIDVQHAARAARADKLTERERRADFVDQLFAAGRLGRRSKAGWYAYGEDGKPAPDPAIEALIAAHAERHGLTLRAIDDTEIRERLLYAMVNEGARLIDEGVVARPHEIDIAMVHGIGFPSYLGGPLWWADTLGLASVGDAVARFQDKYGSDYWPLSPRLTGTGKLYS